MERQKWVDHVFSFDIDTGWAPNIVTRLQGTVPRMRHYAKGLSEEAAAHRPDVKWSIKEQIGHLSDLEDLHQWRLRQFKELVPELKAADMSNAQTEKADHNQVPLGDLIGQFEEKRNNLIATFLEMSDEVQHHKAFHPRLKVYMRPVDMLFFTAEHDDHHLTYVHQQTVQKG